MHLKLHERTSDVHQCVKCDLIFGTSFIHYLFRPHCQTDSRCSQDYEQLKNKTVTRELECALLLIRPQ